MANTIFNSGALPLDEIIKKTFDLFKHLQGEPPKSIKKADGGVAVENNTGEILVVNNPVFNIVVNSEGAPSAEKFAKRPLERQADAIEVSVNGKLAARAEKDSAEFFKAIGEGEKLGEFIAEQHLTIQTAVLEGDGNWRFSDGRNKLRADIEVACPRFRRHQVRCFNGTGGASWSVGNLRGNSSLRLCD